MARIYTTEIDGEEYIGESLFKINDNFSNIDNLQQTLSAVQSFTLEQAILALKTSESTLTSFNALVTRLNTSGVFRTPVSIYVSPTGSDTYNGSLITPFATVDKALNVITGVAGLNSTVNSARTEKKFDFYIVLKDVGTYTLSSAISLEDFPGNIHFVGAVSIPVLSAYMQKPSKAGEPYHDVIYPGNIPNFNIGGNRLAASLGSQPSFKIFQSSGKNVVPLPGYVNHYYSGVNGLGMSALTAVNVSTVRGISGQNTQNVTNLDYGPRPNLLEQNYKYVMLGTRNRELQDGPTSYLSDQILNYKNTTFQTILTTFSGIPMFLTNQLNWEYTNVDIIQLLKYVGSAFPTTPATFLTNYLKAFGTEGVENNILAPGTIPPIAAFVPTMTQYDISNVLFYNNTCGYVLSSRFLPTPIDDWSIQVDLTGSLLADRWRPAIVPGDTGVYGTHNTIGSDFTGPGAQTYIPFFVKAFYELYRGVYDKVSPDITVLQASAFNLDYNYAAFDPAPTFNRLLSTTRMPKRSAGGKSGYAMLSIQPLPTTLLFTNSADAGFNIRNTNVSFKNVFIRGPRQPLYINEFKIDNSVGINVSRGGKVILDSTCAVANFKTGVQAVDGSTVLITGDTTFRLTDDPALTVTDNTDGIILRNSNLFTTGPRLIVARNYENGIQATNSNIYQQGLDLLYNGGTALYLDSSVANIANICVIANRYGIDCRRNSRLNVSLDLAIGGNQNRDYVYINQVLNTPNIIYCNNLLDDRFGRPAVNVQDNSFVLFDRACFIKNALSGITVDLSDSSSGEFNNCMFMGGRSLHNGHVQKGIRADGGRVQLFGTTLKDMCTGVELIGGAYLKAQNTVISRSNVGIGCQHDARVNMTLLNYPTGNNVFNANITNIYTAGNHNRITCEAEHVNYKAFAIHLTGANNFAVMSVDNSLAGTSFVSLPPVSAYPTFYNNTILPLTVYAKQNIRRG